MGLLREVLEEQGIHGAFQADVQFRNLALGQRHQLHAGELKMLVQSGDISLVARNPIERLGEDHLKLTGLGILQQRLHTWAQRHTGADMAASSYVLTTRHCSRVT